MATKAKKKKKTAKTPEVKDDRKDLVICNEIIKNYDNRNVAVEALRGINLEIKEDEFVAIVGSSGSGKTTLLNLIGGLDSPTSGDIFYLGGDISKMSEEERILFRRRIGYVFQDFNLHPVLTAIQNIELPMIYAEELTKAERNVRSELLLKQVGLGKRKYHIPAELSSGEKQRVGIARALANKPRLILADQPTGNLDSETGSMIIELLTLLKNMYKFSIIIVTHNLEVAKQADRILAIKDGLIAPYVIED
ncbi:MAG: ABC transporter ATP-binding protein [Candidatus Heimdallarchaeota archaeon]